MSHSHDLPPELLEAASVLAEHRPQMTEPELARVKRSISIGGRRPATRPTGGFMRSRLAITTLLATGALMSSGGAALGVSALSTDLTASSAQYGTPAVQSAPPASGTLGATTQGAGDAVSPAGTTAPTSTRGQSAVAGARTSAAPRAVAQAPRQLETSSADKLPFTGFAAIPLLLVGLALLGSGLVLRRGTRRAPPQA
jgi:hypothetical protein